MYQPSTPPSRPHLSGRAALIYGISAGTALGLVECAIDIYTIHARYNAFSALGGPFNFLLWIATLLLIGALAGKSTGKIGAGALMGLWAGMSSGAILAISGFFILLSFSAAYFSFNVNGLVAVYLSALVILVVVLMSIGTGLGALGGLIGQSFFAPAYATIHPHGQSDPPQPQRAEDD